MFCTLARAVSLTIAWVQKVLQLSRRLMVFATMEAALSVLVMSYIPDMLSPALMLLSAPGTYTRLSAMAEAAEGGRNGGSAGAATLAAPVAEALRSLLTCLSRLPCSMPQKAQ